MILYSGFHSQTASFSFPASKKRTARICFLLIVRILQTAFHQPPEALLKPPVVFFGALRRTFQVVLAFAESDLCHMALHQQTVDIFICVPSSALMDGFRTLALTPRACRFARSRVSGASCFAALAPSVRFADAIVRTQPPRNPV